MLRDPFRRDGPIVTAMGDDDFYKLSMLGLIWAEPRLRDARVRFSFKNRTRHVALGRHIDENVARRELEQVPALTFTETELRYIGGHFASETTPHGENNRRMFRQEFIDALRSYRLSQFRLVREPDDTYTLDAVGTWFSATLWEIHALQVMSQLYFESLIAPLSTFERQAVWAEATRRLQEKVRVLKRHPTVTVVDFGTRRRACLAWQRFVTEVLLHELGPSQFRGTSNVMLSMELHTVPMGTFAHELVMGMAGIEHDGTNGIVASQNEILDLWFQYYGQPLSVALSDTYGTGFFLKTFGADRARLWKGTRQDSGDPFVYGESLIAYYRRIGVDPMTKLIVFSDGLDVETIVALAERFRGRINVTFGWGTNLTNDFGPGFEPLSLVMKLLECNGHPTVKLTDNLAKAMGRPEDIERFRQIFGYDDSFTKPCRY